MPAIIDWIVSPLTIIDNIFDSLPVKTDWESRVETYFEERITSDILLQIPTLNNFAYLKQQQLVRFQCMIQDMLDTEYFCDTYFVKDLVSGVVKSKTGRYRDTLDYGCKEELIEDNIIHKDRLNFVCVSIPGRNKWTEEVSNTLDYETGKRKFNDTEIVDVKYKQRRLDSMNEHFTSETKSTSLPVITKCVAKIHCRNFNLKLNEMVELFGIISMQSNELTSFTNGYHECLPIIHVILVKPLIHCIPHSMLTVDRGSFQIETLREVIISIMQSTLCNDRLVAEYLLCHLLSNIYIRTDVAVVGKFPLNICGIQNNDFVNNLYTFLQEILDRSCFLNLNLSMLNTARLIPIKNYDTNHLETGVLQLSSGTHVILDETQMSEGQLNEQGVQNIEALNYLIENQQLHYDFKFHHIDYDANFPVLILSKGRSILKVIFVFSIFIVIKKIHQNNIQIYMTWNNNETFKETEIMDENLLNAIRVYLVTAQKQSYSIPVTLNEKIQDYFVEQRQLNAKFSAENLHVLLNLARLQTLSFGLQELTENIWERTKCMEHIRRSRLQQAIT